MYALPFITVMGYALIFFGLGNMGYLIFLMMQKPK